MGPKRLVRIKCVGSVVLFTRLAVGAMFIISGLHKIRLPFQFLSDIYHYEIVGPRLSLLIALLLPWAELIVGICLLGGIFISAAFLVSACLGLVFSTAIAYAMIRGLNISCGCFGAGSAPQVGASTLIRSVTICIVSLLACVWTARLSPTIEP